MTRARILQTVCTLASLMILAACTQDEATDGNVQDLPEGEYPLTLTAGGLQAVATPTKTSTPITRGTVDNDWNEVGAVAVQVGSEVKAYTATSTDDGKTATLTFGNPFYWQSSGEEKKITAWHPYSDSDPAQWRVKANQNSEGGYQASDLIKGELTLAFTDKDDPEKNKITFQHQTAKVIVNLTTEGGVVLNENTSVQLLNVEGVEASGTTVTLYRPNNQKQTYLALVNGQEIQANENFIQVTAGGNYYYYKPKEAKTLSDGTAYTYNIKVKNTGLEVTVSESIAWGTGNTGSGSMEEVPDINLSSLTKDYTISGDGEYLVVGSGTHGLIINGSPTVRLSGVTINTAATAIKVESGSPVIVLEGENSFTASNRNASVISLAGSGANITIEGHNTGSLTINNTDTSNPLNAAIIGGNANSDAGNITIQNATLEISAATNVNSSIIGSGYSWDKKDSRCENIEIDNTDLTIKVTSGWIGGAYIGSGEAQEGNITCGDITIRLKKDESKDAFLNKLTATNELFQENLWKQHPDKVGKGGVYVGGTSTCGTITWYDSNGQTIP